VPYDRLRPEDAVAVDLDTGRQVRGELRPTSELPLHLAVYRGTCARAIVHTHAPHATAVSTLVGELPPIHYMTADLGGVVRVADYALYGTPELAEAVLRALDRAYDRGAQLEWMCRVWLAASSAGMGAPAALSTAELSAASAKLSGYGQP
jgi:L-fuculose-phosphate aldolase